MKKIFLLLALILLVFTLSGQSAEKTGSLLWKISGNGLTQPSYIFGTHHAYPVSFLDSIAGLKEAFASSQQVVGELVMNDMMAIAFELQRAGMMPPDSTWQMLLSEDDYRFVDEQLTAFLGVGLQSLGVLKPSIVSMTYTMVFYQRIFPQINPSESMDLWFQQQAASREISVIGLETVQDQINAVIFGSLRRQAANLVCAMRNTDHTEYSARKLNRLYRTADLSGLFGMLREESPCPMSADQESVFNDVRNKRWLEKLPAIIADKPSFIAVGALHLPGEVGLLRGLERAGYIVEAVR